MRRVLAATAALLVVLAAPSYAAPTGATFPEYQRVHAGWYRDHVQRVFGLPGRRVALWYDARGVRHLVKSYRTDTTDTRVEVTYRGAPSANVHARGYRVASKALVGS